MKTICITAIMVLMGFTSIAQMQFVKTTHDFGQVAEAEGEVSYQFEFTNTGSSPVIITNVVSSCGCTTPEWTKQPVLPGKSGSIKAIFDPKDRPGIFDKEITVTTKTEQVRLKISGEVLPKTKGVTDLYPRVIGTLRLKSLSIPFANTRNTTTVIDSLSVINTGAGDLNLTFDNVPAHIKLEAYPQSLKAGESGKIVCTYNAAKKNDWGYVTDKVNVLLNGKAAKNNELTISATISEDFSTLNEADLANAPIAQITRSVNLGSVKSGANKEFFITIVNNGKSDLLLRKISTNCDCITLASDNPKSVKAGQSVEVKGVFSTAKMKGKVTKNVSIITNAPKQAITTVRISATIE